MQNKNERNEVFIFITEAQLILFERISKTTAFQKATYYVAKGHLSGSKKPHFATQNAAF